MLFFNKKSAQFHCSLTIHSFNHVPLADDFVCLKIKPPRSVSRPHTSPNVPISSSCAFFNTSFNWNIYLNVDSTSLLLDSCIVRISVRQPIKRSSHVRLGFCEIDLAQFAGESNTSFIIPLEDCRFRGTLRCTISLLPLSGVMTFRTPPINSSIRVEVPVDEKKNTTTRNDLRVHLARSGVGEQLFASPLTPANFISDSPPCGTPTSLNQFVDDLFSDRRGDDSR
ncbi:hypothetical protein RCL1_000507 [Eukaryota sp. TZLM3-RCL]